jgi:hypothetical protein
MGRVLPFLIKSALDGSRDANDPWRPSAGSRNRSWAIRRQFAPFGGVDLDLPLEFVDAAPSQPLAAAPVAAVRPPRVQ